MLDSLVLIIDDSKIDAETIASFLTRRGYATERAHNKATGIAAAKELLPDLIVLDMVMEGPEDGLEVIAAMKQNPGTSNIPIIVFSITGDDPTRRVQGVDHGATRYLPKIKDLAELDQVISKTLDRAEAQMKKLRQLPLFFDEETGEIWKSGVRLPVELPALLAKLLSILYRRRGRICTFDMLIDSIYDKDSDESGREALAQLVSRLKIAIQDDSSPPLIKNVRTRGYKLVVDTAN